MRTKVLSMALALAAATPMPSAAQPATAPAMLTIRTDQPGATIGRDIFGQFAEMLGEGVYGGIWVGRDSAIPNVRGIRSDVVQALRAIRVPVVRWPGGCFADKYNWRNGIGPASARRTTLNMWGNVPEPNGFGTDEYFDFVDQIGSEAYVSINLGSAPPADAADWLEYMTVPSDKTTLGRLRATNGHAAPYRIKYLGLGNEPWGCGGNMSADQYVGEMKRYATFATNLNPAQAGPFPGVAGPVAMKRVAAGPDGDKTEFTEAIMKASSQLAPYTDAKIDALSLHFYASGKAGILRAPSTGFDGADYAFLLKEMMRIDGMIAAHAAIMDKYDPKKRIALVVDEFGAWYQPMPGRPFMFLRQQNSLRDAISASLNLNIFARHADRVRMANIAQMVNVIQAMILTDGARMLLTPTYHIYKMYVPFQDATLVPVTLDAGNWQSGEIVLPRVDALAARGKDGKLWLALTNLDPDHAAEVVPQVGTGAARGAHGTVLTAARVDAVNSFDAPGAVASIPFDATAAKGRLVLKLPPKSVTVVRLDD